jgi:uncharacterized protein YfbU (UPF0304 family)
MVPKTERVEMRFDPALLDRIDVWRAAEDDVPNRTEAVRRLIEGGLSLRGDNHLQLDRPQKLMTWMLAEILARVGKPSDRVEKVDLILNALYGGHLWALDWELSGVLHDYQDSPRAVTEVVDTLDMWDFVESAVKKLGTEDRKRLADEVEFVGKNPRFMGYDGNNETQHMGIANFLVQDLDRFSRFKGRDMNSHMPMRERYRQMFALFEPMRKTLVGRELSVEQVITLLKRA